MASDVLKLVGAKHVTLTIKPDLLSEEFLGDMRCYGSLNLGSWGPMGALFPPWMTFPPWREVPGPGPQSTGPGPGPLAWPVWPREGSPGLCSHIGNISLS